MKYQRTYARSWMFRATALWLLTGIFVLAAAAVYQCPMHPWIKSDAPGKCTICGMNLVLADRAGDTAGEGTVALTLSQVTTVGVETTMVTRQPVTRTLRVNGRIDDDDTRHRILAARVPGRVEKLNVTYTGEKVSAGEPLATIYSPEMLTAQRVYLERFKAGNIAYAPAELSAARERLQEVGLTQEDVAHLEQTKEPSALIVVRAPSAGTVVTKSVYEGQYVQVSDRLFEIADFSTMWFVFDVYEQDIAWLRAGQTVEITTRAMPGEVMSAPIAFIDPNFDELTRTTKARAVISNPHPGVSGDEHILPHRVLAEGRVLVSSSPVLAVARTAVLDAGNGPIAYVDVGQNHYVARSLKLGRRGDGLVEIISGVNAGDRVVTNGALLIDAQAQLSSNHGGDPAPVKPRAESSAPPAIATAGADEFARLAAAAIDGATLLARDDFAAYQQEFAALTTAATGKNLPKLELGTDLKSARQSFEPWSTAVADLLKPHRAELGLKIFQCPMSPVSRHGRWIQRSEPLKNPFFGSAMADCGEEVR